jgi:hypothetical protein
LITIVFTDIQPYHVYYLVYFEPEPVKREKKSTRSKKSKKDGGNKDLGTRSEYSGELSGKRKELLRVAKKYRITELISRYVNIPVNADVFVCLEDYSAFSSSSTILIFVLFLCLLQAPGFRPK